MKLPTGCPLPSHVPGCPSRDVPWCLPTLDPSSFQIREVGASENADMAEQKGQEAPNNHQLFTDEVFIITAQSYILHKQMHYSVRARCYSHGTRREQKPEGKEAERERGMLLCFNSKWCLKIIQPQNPVTHRFDTVELVIYWPRACQNKAIYIKCLTGMCDMPLLQEKMGVEQQAFFSSHDSTPQKSMDSYKRLHVSGKSLRTCFKQSSQVWKVQQAKLLQYLKIQFPLITHHV